MLEQILVVKWFNIYHSDAACNIPSEIKRAPERRAPNPILNQQEKVSDSCDRIRHTITAM